MLLMKGMPRILGCTAHITPMVLSALGIEVVESRVAATFPKLPEPYKLSEERLKELREADPEAYYAASIKDNLASAKKVFAIEKAPGQLKVT